MEQLIKELKKHLIEELNLEEITVDDIDAEAPLFHINYVLIVLHEYSISL